jgi:shikimate kinase
MKLIKETSTSIYLKMNSEALFSRYVQSKKPRPLFSHMDNEQVKQYIENTLRKREGYYEQADITIDALSCKVDDIMLKINH